MPSHRHIKCDIKTSATTHTHWETLTLSHNARKQMEMNIRTKGANTRMKEKNTQNKPNNQAKEEERTKKAKIKWKYIRGYGIHLHLCVSVSVCVFLIRFALLDGWKHYSTYLGTTLRTICCLLFSFFFSFPHSSVPLLYLTHHPIPMSEYALSWHAEMDAKFNTKIWVHLILESTLHNNKNKSERAHISSHS